MRSINLILADLDTINEEIKRFAPGEGIDVLERARKSYEGELAQVMEARRMDNLHPRFAGLFESFFPETSIEQEGQEENLRIKKMDKGYINPFDEIHEWDLQADAELDRKLAREEAWQE